MKILACLEGWVHLQRQRLERVFQEEKTKGYGHCLLASRGHRKDALGWYSEGREQNVWPSVKIPQRSTSEGIWLSPQPTLSCLTQLCYHNPGYPPPLLTCPHNLLTKVRAWHPVSSAPQLGLCPHYTHQINGERSMPFFSRLRLG